MFRGELTNKNKMKFVILFSFILYAIIPFNKISFAINVSENSIENLRKLEKKALKQLIKNTKILHNQRSAQISLKSRINALECKINYFNISIFKLQAEVKILKKDISKFQKNISELMDTLKEGLRTIYTSQNPTFFEILAASKNFDDFYDRTEITKFVLNKILGIIEEINSKMNKVDEKQREINKKLKIIEQQKEEILKKRQELEILFKKSESTEIAARKELDVNNEELKKIEEDIKSFSKEHAPVECVKNDSKFLEWPVPGYKKISSYFNDTIGRKYPHKGIDITGKGVYGAKVVSAAAGIVVGTNNSGWGGGYGKFVAVNHGNYETWYGHLSGITVTRGTQIKSGQTIGFVGHTGQSTGPHLHFELRKNGTKLDPIHFFKYY